MKKLLVILLSGVLVFSLFSCNGDKESDEIKKAENLDELKEKFEDKEFEDCDKFLAATEEMMDVYLDILEKSLDDEDLYEELEELEIFFDTFNDDFKKFEDECPDKFNKMEEEVKERIAEIMS